MIIHSPIISGSLTFADGATVTYPEGGVYSGSFSGSYQGSTFTGGVFTGDGSGLTFGGTGIVSSSAQLADVFLDTLGDGVISGSSQVEFNDINNNPFTQGASSVTTSKSIIPSSLTLDLGSAAYPFRDLYLSSASLYIDGQQVISSNNTDLTITTDTNQSLRIVETGADTITLQTENGDLTLVSTGTGNIELNAPIQIGAGNQILSSDGNAIQFGEDINVQGNITVTGTVDSVDVAALKDTVDAILAGSQADKDSFAEIVSLINSVDTGNDEAFASFYTSSNQRMGSLEDFTASIDSTIKTKLNADSIISQSGQVVLESADKTGFTGASSITTLGTVTSGDVKAILPAGTISGSEQIDYAYIGLAFHPLASGTNVVVSGSSQISADQTEGWAADVKTQLNANTVISSSAQITITESQISDLDHYTNADFDARLATKTTTDLDEGLNKYYTDARVKAVLNNELVVSGSYVSTTSAQALSSNADALTFAGNVLTLRRGDGSTDTVNLSAYLDDTNLARVISGVYDTGSQELVFTRDDSTTFSIDASMFLDDTNLVTSVNGRTGGVITSLSDYSITATAAEINKLDGVTASTAEINILDGLTASTAELNFVDGVTSNIQTQFTSVDSRLDVLEGESHENPLTFTDSSTIDFIRTGDSISANAIGGIVSSSAQVDYNSIQNKPSIPSTENIQDIVGGMVSGNTETGITVTYQDADGTLDFVVASQTDNNFTNALKSKLDGIEAGANNYVHPTYDGDDISLNTSGAQVIDTLTITTDTQGHVSDASVTTRNLTLSNLGVTATATELNYVDGVTSNIQSQLNSKLATATYSTDSASFDSRIDGLEGESHENPLTFVDSTTIDFTRTGDSITADVIGGVVSGSAQVDHDATTNFVSNEHINHANVTLTAGAGLTGGGNILASRTFNVGQGDGISVAADSIGVDGTVLRTTTTFGGDVSGTYNNIVIADDSHNHIIGNIDGLQAALNSKVDENSAITAGTATKITFDSKGLVTGGTSLSASDIPNLDASKITTGTIDPARLPSYVDDVVEAADFASLPATGSTGKIYVTLDTGDIYRWSGSAYVQINDSVSSADQATKLATARTITIGSTGKTFDGTGNVSWTLGEIGAQAAGTYNTIIGTDTDISYTGATVLSTLTLTDGVVQGHTSRTLTVADLGLTATTTELNYVDGVTSNIQSQLNGKLGSTAKAADSNLLDGLDSSAFLRSNATDTASGVITFSNTTASTSTTTGAVKIAGGLGVGGDAFVGGDVVAYASSDERLKKNIEIISKPIDKVMELRGVTWNWKDEASEAQKATPAIGVIAQDVEKVLPQLVDTRENGYKAVDYGKMVGLLIEAIKDQQKQIDELKSRLQ